MPAAASLLPVCFLCLLALSSACYFQNCPRGGKRAFPDTDVRQCNKCGRHERYCFGREICCSEAEGCTIGAGVSPACKEEEDNPVPCASGWKECGEMGFCASHEVCCSHLDCWKDPQCVRE